MNEPTSHEIKKLPNGDIIYENSIWWNSTAYDTGENPIRTNWDDPLNVRLIFDKEGNLKSAEKI